tara:strand:+ start:1710 stop:2219 length:510 start_codon:yes stop_codon:yes gene_type:complete
VNHSHYQHQDPRQISLQQLIEQALHKDDQQLLTRLELQWVHRFGVDTLPSGCSAADEDSSSSSTVSDAEQELAVIAAPESSAEPEPEPEPEPVAAVEESTAVEPEEESPGLTRVTSLLRDCLDDVGRAVEPEAPANAAAQSLRPVPAAGPQRLRRWLAPVSQDDLPRAS